MSDITFDRDELAQLLLQALETKQGNAEDEPGTITTPEFMKATRKSDKPARRALIAAEDAGIIQSAMITRVNRLGFEQRIAGWRFVNPPESPD